MKRYLHIIILCVVVSSHAQPPQVQWSRTYGGTGSENLSSALQSPDDGYILTGWTRSFGEGENDIYVVKTDATGDTLWTRLFGGWNHEYSWDVCLTSDNGFVIGAETNTFGVGYYDAYNIKLDTDGDTVWTGMYGSFGSDWCGSIAETPDNGFIFTGATSSFGAGVADLWLVKTDSEGELEWLHPFGGEDYDFGYCVCLADEGGYAACGATMSFGAGDRDVYIVRTEDSGDTLWTRSYGTAGSENGTSIINSADGGFIITGSQVSVENWDRSVFVLKVDSDGDLEWSRTYGGPGSDGGKDVIQIPHGEYLVVGSTESFGNGEKDVYILKLDSQGDTLWTTTVGGEFDESGTTIQLTSDGGMFVAGIKANLINNSVDYWLVKFMPEASIVNLQVTPQGIPIQIPPGGGSFNFDAVVTNLTDETQIVDAWTEVVTPSGNRFGPLILVEDIPLDPFGEIEGSPVQNVPAEAPAAIYTYVTWIGDYTTGIIYDSQSFQVEKTAEVLLEINSDTGFENWNIDGFFENPQSSQMLQKRPVIDKINKPSLTSKVYPNPFNSTATITFFLQEEAFVSIDLYNIKGQLVRNITGRSYRDGEHGLSIQVENLPNGVYFLSTGIEGETSGIEKIVLIK